MVVKFFGYKITTNIAYVQIFVYFYLHMSDFFCNFAAQNCLKTMILDKLENADWYFDSVPGLKEFMKFYNENDLEELPACKIFLDGKDLFVNIVDFKGKEESKCRMEAHKDYLDIQIPLGDDEVMGWKAQVDCQDVTQEYDEGKDVEFYGDKATAKFTVPAGHFAVFFPTDAHQPGIAPGKEYRKLIVKARVNQ